jgi:hypothetical protein
MKKGDTPFIIITILILVILAIFLFPKIQSLTSAQEYNPQQNSIEVQSFIDNNIYPSQQFYTEFYYVRPRYPKIILNPKDDTNKPNPKPPKKQTKPQNSLTFQNKQYQNPTLIRQNQKLIVYQDIKENQKTFNQKPQNRIYFDSDNIRNRIYINSDKNERQYLFPY